MRIETLLFWVGAITATIAFVGLIHRTFFVPLYKKIKWHEDFRKLWDGVEATDTMKEIPGVVKRLNRIDGELKSNGGSTMKDIVDRNHEDLQTVMQSLDKICQSVERMEDRQIITMRDIESEIKHRRDDRVRTEYNTKVLWEAVESLGVPLPDPIEYGDDNG